MYPFNLPLSAAACCWVPFRLLKYHLSNTFPNIKLLSRIILEKISIYPKENEPEVFLHTYPHTNLACNVISAYVIVW